MRDRLRVRVRIWSRAKVREKIERRSKISIEIGRNTIRRKDNRCKDMKIYRMSYSAKKEKKGTREN